MNLPVIDIIFLIIIFMCAVHGAFRGFLDELFSKLAIIVALFCGLFNYKRLLPSLPDFGAFGFLANILSFLIIFVVVYIVVRIVQKIIGAIFRGDIMKGLDKSLGFFLGIGEGLLIVGVVLFLLYQQPFFDVSGILNGSNFAILFSRIGESIPQKIPTSPIGNTNV